MHGAIHTVIPDRIEAGTYLIAAAMAGGDVFVENALPEHLKPVVAKLKEAGVTVEEEIDGIRVISTGKGLKLSILKPCHTLDSQQICKLNLWPLLRLRKVLAQ